jgi:N-acetyl-beta-hexosaminidase
MVTVKVLINKENYLKEIAQLFPDPAMHLGGDEVLFFRSYHNNHKVTYNCWQEDASIREWLNSVGKGGNFPYLVEYFERGLVKIVSKLNKTLIRWEEAFGSCFFLILFIVRSFHFPANYVPALAGKRLGTRFY